jgi:prepilin peptidase CpaA
MLDVTAAIMPYAFTFLVIYGALSDLSTFRIPNWVSYGLVLLFALQVLASWLDNSALPNLGPARPSYLINVVLALAVFAVAVVFWRMRVIGGGDVKYLTAISLWMGPGLALYFVLLLTVLAVAFAAALKLLVNWAPAVQGAGAPAMLKRLLARISQNQLPYGFPIGLAALVMIPWLFAA